MDVYSTYYIWLIVISAFSSINQTVGVSLEAIIAAIGLLITIIAISVAQGSRISVLENRAKTLEDNLKIHESLNERTFSKLEDELKDINEKLNKLIGYFEATKKGKL